MILEQLEAEVLALPKDSQAKLLARLLGHLGQTQEIDQEVSSIWAEEAERRDQAMDYNQVSASLLKKYFNEFVHLCNENCCISSLSRARVS